LRRAHRPGPNIKVTQMSGDKRKVSVVVPTYNQARYLGACLDSIFFQDYPNLEIIVVSDPSPDDTSRVLREFVKAVGCDKASFASRYDAEAGLVERVSHHRYPQRGRKLVIIENPARLGHSASYNLGFRKCSGDYCTYVASDDVCHPQMISTLAAELDAGDVDFVYSDMFIINDEGRILREFRLPNYSFSRCFEDWYLCGVSKLYRRELHERCGYFSEAHLANDHECYLRFALEGARFRHVPKALYSVRSHEGRCMDVHCADNEKRLFRESIALTGQARKAGEGRR
jgi:glycosyltransferase involved in cell wall biosynthesis